jgi:hypothetical protein
MTSKINARFCANNWLDSASLSSSSFVSGFPATNLVHPLRGKLWKAAGAFEISASNGKVYIDGSTYTVPAGIYSVTTLITAFNTATGKTLSRNVLGRFVITSGGSCTLTLSNQTDAIWGVLGYLTTTNIVGTVFTADERRYSTGEWVKVDMGLSQRPDFAALIPEANAVFSARLASVRLQGNNLDTWAAPPVDVAMTVTDAGAFVAPDDLQPCRFWRVLIDDPTNIAISCAVGYIGTSFTPTATNIATGFNRTRSDQSVPLYSEAGALYVDRRPKVLALSSVEVQFLKDDELKEVEQLFYDLGIERPFFLCIDPKQGVSQTIDQMTHYVAVTSPLSLRHVLRGYYNLSVELREVL